MTEWLNQYNIICLVYDKFYYFHTIFSSISHLLEEHLKVYRGYNIQSMYNYLTYIIGLSRIFGT